MPLSSAATFERSPVRGSTIDDLDGAALERFLSQRARRLFDTLPLEQLAERAGLASKTGSSTAPTVAGLLIFGYHPQLLHPEWGLSAVRVDGRVLSDPLAERQDIEGCLPELLEAGMAFVDKHTRSVANQVELAERAQEYAAVAVRETLVNALVHRDWGMPGRVALRVFNDRLEIWSPGGPPTPFSLEELSAAGGVSLPRNPLLAGSCRLLGMGEQVGRGLPTIRRSVAEAAGHPVAIETTKTEVCVIIPSGLQALTRTS